MEKHILPEPLATKDAYQKKIWQDREQFLKRCSLEELGVFILTIMALMCIFMTTPHSANAPSLCICLLVLLFAFKGATHIVWKYVDRGYQEELECVHSDIKTIVYGTGISNLLC